VPESENLPDEVTFIALWGVKKFDRCTHNGMPGCMATSVRNLVGSNKEGEDQRGPYGGATVSTRCKNCGAELTWTWNRSTDGEATFQ